MAVACAVGDLYTCYILGYIHGRVTAALFVLADLFIGWAVRRPHSHRKAVSQNVSSRTGVRGVLAMRARAAAVGFGTWFGSVRGCPRS